MQTIGTSSLMSEERARSKYSSLTNFELVYLRNAVRVFGKVDKQGLHRQKGNIMAGEIAGCFLEGRPGGEVIVSVFDVDAADFEKMKRNHYEYDAKNFPYFHDRFSMAPAGEATAFFGFDNDRYLRAARPDADEVFWPEIRETYDGEIYRDDILPEHFYLKTCLETCMEHGPYVWDHFLDHSFLADGETRLREYVEEKGGEDADEIQPISI